VVAPDYAQKLPLQQSLNELATNRALEAIQRTGRALPCKVTAVNPKSLGYSIVTVSFDVQGGPWTLPPLTLPKAESQWLRAPTQVGDFGITVPADTFLGGVSGLGNGVADITVDYGNLSTLVWVPIGSTSFGAAPDPKKAWVNGPNGAVLSDQQNTVSVTCDNTAAQIIITAGSFSLIVDKATGTVQIGGSGTTSGDAIVRQSDLQNALTAMASNILAWANANYAHGTGTAVTGPAAPTPTASQKSYTA
jgi:hypothetical protein